MKIFFKFLFIVTVQFGALNPKGEWAPSWLQASAQNSDRYQSFYELEKAYEGREKPYKIQTKKRDSDVLALAIHGGTIEPFTDQLATQFAGEKYNYYLFIGDIPGRAGFEELHITSTRFDEPQALNMTSQARRCVSFHGFTSKEGFEKVCMGGAHYQKRDKILNHLKLAFTDVMVEICPALMGQHPQNIVNRCAEPGVQIELSGPFRKRLRENPKDLEMFLAIVRAGVIDNDTTNTKQPSLH